MSFTVATLTLSVSLYLYHHTPVSRDSIGFSLQTASTICSSITSSSQTAITFQKKSAMMDRSQLWERDCGSYFKAVNVITWPGSGKPLEQHVKLALSPCSTNCSTASPTATDRPSEDLTHFLFVEENLSISIVNSIQEATNFNLLQYSSNEVNKQWSDLVESNLAITYQNGSGVNYLMHAHNSNGVYSLKMVRKGRNPRGGVPIQASHTVSRCPAS